MRAVALQGAKDEAIDLSFALDQIRGRQIARQKIPSWSIVDGLLYPPHLSMEQCSSDQTAQYKAAILFEFNKQNPSLNGRFVDLTGGMGVDFSFMSRNFHERVYVEQNSNLCELARHNMPLLGVEATIENLDSTEFLRSMASADVIFIDPARRNESGGRTYSIADCTPNVLELMPLLLQKAQVIILKLSPMLDWHKAVEDLTERKEERSEMREISVDVHIVSVGNECKELVVVLSKAEKRTPMHVVCANLSAKESEKANEILEFDVEEEPNDFSFKPETDSFRLKTASFRPKTDSFTSLYLYEPNASIMKAGCFDVLCKRYGVGMIAPNSHLFLSDSFIEDFPGRRFCVVDVCTMNKKEVRKMLKGIDRANITTRNFPLSANQLRGRLKLKDGGDNYLFATTDDSGAHLLFLVQK